jgi:RHS repeat-associated protein
MLSTRPRTTIAISLFLSYLLIVLLCTPVAVSSHGTFAVKPPTQNQVAARYRDGEILVRFRGGVSEKEKETIIATHGAQKKKQLRGDSGFEKLELTAGRDAKATVLQLLLNPQVEFAEPNFLIAKEDVTPNDPQFKQQWALQNSGQDGGQFGADIKAASAWQTATGAPSTVIAVLDSGIDFNHPDLINNQWTNPRPNSDADLHGWDFVADNAEIKDEQGHGTAVAGVIAAEGNNGIGTTGVMWRASLMSLRVLDNTGTGDVASAVEAIDYAVTRGAHVVNLSWGTTGESIALKEAIERALRRNIVVVCSSGNGSQNLDVSPYYPASFGLKDLIVVGATDNRDQPASWSNWSVSRVTVAAPGTNILTTQRGGGYWSVTGTSAAAPVVTGIAGLMKTVNPRANTSLISRAISNGARQVVSLSGKVSSGGVADAAGALAKVYGSANQSPALPPRGLGTGGNGPGGSFSTTPPALLREAPIANLPNLDEARKATFSEPKAQAPIQANLPCADCDPYSGGGGAGNYPSGDPGFSEPRTLPPNETGQPGVDLGSQNLNWGLPLVSLPGRAGLDLNLTLTYNSLVWTKDGSFIKYNADMGNPAPGFRLGLPIIQPRFLNSALNIYAYMMVTPAGGRVELRQIGSSNIYESQDSGYTQLDVSNPNALLLRTTDGTQYTFVPVSFNNENRCTTIKDRNGNYISASYNTTNGHMESITDTLQRTLNFIYDANGNLQAIRQTWAGSVSHDWATFSYGQVHVAPGFGGGLQINGPNNNDVTVLTQVTLHDASYFTFNYNAAFGQVNRINHYAADNHLLNYTSYNMNSNSGQTDCPRFTEQRDWAQNWNNGNEAVTSFSTAGDNSWMQQTMPDGTIYKEFFHTSGWQTGLTHTTEVWSGGSKKKWSTVSYTQDDTGLSYKKNPRVTETNIYDEVGNRRRTVIEYIAAYALWGLPYCTHEYAADGITELRRTYYDYNLSQVYLDRRIIGLVSAIHLTDVGSFQGKIVYEYDDPARLQAVPAAATQHDTAYNTSFTARGNVTSVSRWDVTDITNPAKKLATYTSYYTTGTPISTTDASGHQSTISYTDSFSDGVNRNAFAYPTTVTDADSFSSTVQYNYDFGAVTRAQDPKGAVQTIIYDSVARIDRITNQTSGAYLRYFYSPEDYVSTFATIQDGAGEAYSITYFDGAGRVRAEAGDHPGSSGGYAAMIITYDVMGRVSQQTNPAEINASWIPTGDDAAGWSSTLQTYDWKGRPLVTTNADGSTRENTYGGCGCAGGEQTTVRDENGRRKHYIKDVFGRLVRVEELNWDQTVYATTNYTLNVRDQIVSINQAGQTRSFGFDGYGRVVTRTTPEQGATTATYFADGTTQTITDARGATKTFAYNGRHLITGITYGVPAGVAATSNVSFGYDSAGNRTSMTDGLGSVSYSYNTLSQLTSETRTFTGLGSYALNYTYNIGGELKSITNPWGAQVGYGYDKIGRLNGVSGSGYVGLTSYVNSLSYRAFGLKQIGYNNGRTLSMQYDNRLRPTEWSVPGVLRMQYSYTWERSGRVEFARNLDDETLDRWFAYDHLGRLTVSRSGNEARLAIGEQVPLLYNGPYSHGYFYDQFGNITTREGWGGTNPVYSASYTNNKMNTATYDAAGNLIDVGGGWTFTYDATGQQATSAVGGVTNVYDGDRLRGKKTESGVTTHYLRSTVLGGQVVAEITTSGTWYRGYVYLGNELLAVQQDLAVHWVHQDPVVKSKRITNSSGTVVSTIELDPWGGETDRNSNEAFQPHKFTSYERDGIGSDDAMHRRYNRWWSRFEQPDPYDGSYNLADPQSFNRYAYVQNDPVNFVDPLGLDRFDDPLGPPPPVPTLIPYGGTIVTNTSAPRPSGGGLGGIFGGGNFVPLDESPEESPGGGGAPQNPATPTRTPFENKLNECTQRLFGVELKSFTASQRGSNGSFTGYGADAYGSGGSDTEIAVVNEVRAYTSNDLRNQYNANLTPGQQPLPAGSFVMGRAGPTPSGYTPYRNFTASNLTNSRAILATQIHELGNSLKAITGVTMGPNSPAGLGGDTDAGTRLERCVFSGEIDLNGRRHRF